MMETIKLIHVVTALLSGAGFLVRGLLMLRDSPMLATRLLRVAPHVNDTVLLAAAIVLTINIQQYPFVRGWLTAKVIALVVYIVLGMIALRRGRTRFVRAVAFAGALVAFGYIVAVAVTRSPSLGIANY